MVVGCSCFLTGEVHAMGSNDVLFSQRSFNLVSEEIMNMMDSVQGFLVNEFLEVHRVLNKLDIHDKKQFNLF